MHRKDNGGSLRRGTVRTDDIGPVGCIFVNFDRYTYQPHGTIVQNEIKIINKTEKGLPIYAIISMQSKPYAFLCQPAVLGSRKFATCFLSQLFYSQSDSKNMKPALFSILFHDMVTFI